MKHLCFVCGNKGTLQSGKPCPLCRLQRSTRMQSWGDTKKIGYDPSEYITQDPLSFKMFEGVTDPKALGTDLREANQKLITIAARIAEQRVAYLQVSKDLSQYQETRDIAEYIEKAYHKMRSAWLLIEKTQRMVDDRIDALNMTEEAIFF